MEPPAEQPAPVAPSVSEEAPIDWAKQRRTVLRFVAELLIVFVGVYGAFLLNAQREQRQLEAKRTQIYNALLEEVKDIDRNTDEFVKGFGPYATRFDSLYRAGEMPRLFPIYTSVRFTPHMWNATLQTAGLDVLDVEMMYQISSLYNNLEMAFGVLDQLVTFTTDVLGPNIEADLDVFYDTTTGELNARHRWYHNQIRMMNRRAYGLDIQTDSVIALLEREINR